MEDQSPILRYLANAHQQQTPVMANSRACVSRLTIITTQPLRFEVELTIDADQVRTYAIQKMTDEPTADSWYQVAPMHKGVAGHFSKLSESDLYYMVTGQALTDDE